MQVEKIERMTINSSFTNKRNTFDYDLSVLQNKLPTPMSSQIKAHLNTVPNPLLIRIGELEKQIDLLQKKFIDQKTWWVRTQEGLQSISITNIVRCEASNNYTLIHFDDGNKLCLSKTLKFSQSQLPVLMFVRIHQSHLVNRQKISKINSKTKRIVLKDGTFLPISRTNFHSVMQQLAQANDHLKIN